MSNPTHDPFYSSPFGPFYRRHSPYMVQPEYRIYEMNKRLQARTEVSWSRAERREPRGGTVPLRLRYRREGSGAVEEERRGEEGCRGERKRREGHKGLSIRRRGCDAKVPNIPEVKVNRL